jgi:hypothetical protein
MKNLHNLHKVKKVHRGGGDGRELKSKGYRLGIGQSRTLLSALLSGQVFREDVPLSNYLENYHTWHVSEKDGGMKQLVTSQFV